MYFSIAFHTPYFILHIVYLYSIFHIFYIVLYHASYTFFITYIFIVFHIDIVYHIIKSFCFVMYYIVLEICIGGHFLEDCFNCYLQQIKSVVANESLIPYNLIKRAPYFFWVDNCYLLTWNLAHILSNLKTFLEAIKAFWMWLDIFTEVIIYQLFQQVTYLLLVPVRLQTLVVFFLCIRTLLS